MKKLNDLPGTATKEQLIATLKDADKLILDNIFFKKLAKGLGKEDAERKEQDENEQFVIDQFESNPAKVIAHYNLRIAIRVGWQNFGTRVFSIAVEYVFSRAAELTGHGMSLEEAKVVALKEVEQELEAAAA